MILEKVKQLKPDVVEKILRDSLDDSSLKVLDVLDPEGLGGLNDGFASDLKKIVVTVEEGNKGGEQRKIHLVVKASLASGESWISVLMGGFLFFKESFWYSTAFPELLKLVNETQRDALVEMVPVVHHASCNYQDQDIDSFLLKNGLLCCCCVFATKPKEKGIILMENLKESNFVDLKAIERTSGGGVKSSHMRMILEAIAHFHGAWMVWSRGTGGMGDKTREEVLFLYKQVGTEGGMYKAIYKQFIKKVTNMFIEVADAKKEEEAKKNLTKLRDSPRTVDMFMKSFSHKDSKFKTICHADFWTSQIMFALNEDGSPKRVKILDYQVLMPGHPALDIWTMVYSATDADYRANQLEDDLRAYFDVLSTYMEEKADFKEFREELEERRMKGITMDALACMLTLSPEKLPSPTKEFGKCLKACKQLLVAEDSPDDHPDIREMRRRVMSNFGELESLDILKEK